MILKPLLSSQSPPQISGASGFLRMAGRSLTATEVRAVASALAVLATAFSPDGVQAPVAATQPIDVMRTVSQWNFVESLMSAIAQGDEAAKQRVRDFLEKRAGKVGKSS